MITRSTSTRPTTTRCSTTTSPATLRSVSCANWALSWRSVSTCRGLPSRRAKCGPVAPSSTMRRDPPRGSRPRRSRDRRSARGRRTRRRALTAQQRSGHELGPPLVAVEQTRLLDRVGDPGARRRWSWASEATLWTMPAGPAQRESLDLCSELPNQRPCRNRRDHPVVDQPLEHLRISAERLATLGMCDHESMATPHHREQDGVQALSRGRERRLDEEPTVAGQRKASESFAGMSASRAARSPLRPAVESDTCSANLSLRSLTPAAMVAASVG